MAATSTWSYSTGERGRNRVRVFVTRHGSLAVEYYEPHNGGTRPRRISLGHRDEDRAKREADHIAARLGDQPRQPRDLLTVGHRNEARAKRAADHIAAQLGDQQPPQRRDSLTLGELFDNYLASEAARGKAANTRSHDRLVARLVKELFGPHTLVQSLGLKKWDRFIAARRRGSMKGVSPVGNRQIEYDLKTLRAAVNWAVAAELIERNPLEKLSLPQAGTDPHRPVLGQQQYESLLQVAPTIGWRFELALLLAHETGRRINSIRNLRWEDIDPKQRRVRWRAAHDKKKRASVTPLTPVAVATLKRVRADQKVISGWVFPSPLGLTQPTSRGSFTKWFRRALEAVGMGDLRGVGYHSLRRKFATEYRGIPLKDLMNLGGWKDSRTLIDCYELPDLEALEEGLRCRIHSLESTPPADDSDTASL